MHRVDEQRARRFGDQDEAVRTHQRSVMGPEGLCQRAALFGELDVARVRVGGDAALPARGARPHRHKRDALHHRKGDRKLHVAV
jgi:hypothetical protein